MIDLAQTVRRPRCRLLISGSVVGGCQAVEISVNNLGQAGSFFVQIASTAIQEKIAAMLYMSDVIDVSIEFCFLTSAPEGSQSDWVELMSGRVDRLRLDPISGLITLEGRDFASRLLDLQVFEGFLNCTSSEVARTLAQRCGLTAVVDQTSSMIGQYYQIEHARLSLNRFSRFSTAWDLLSALAQLEGFDLWVEGQSLYFCSSSDVREPRNIRFHPPNRDSGAPSLNISSLTLERCPALSGGMQVSVASWNSRQRKRFVVRSAGSSEDTTTLVHVVRPNLLPDAAQSLADGICGQAAGHERALNGTMPGDLTLCPRDRLRLTGIGGGWDGDYRVDSVEREVTLAGGFVQRFAAKIVSN